MKKGVIFDLDGTLWDAADQIVVSWNQTILRFPEVREVLTRKRLEEAGLTQRAKVIVDGHEHMENYVRETVSAITFNFGYLPGGDHQIATQADTSIQAIEAGLRLLKKGGIMSLCIYSGGDSGFAEKEALLSYLETLDSRTFLVIVSTYYNRQNHPPIPAFVIRIKEERGE